MYPVALGDLVRRVRQRACLEVTAGVVTVGPSFMPDAEVIDNINTSISPWYDMVLDSTFAGNFIRAPWVITTQNAVDTYALAPNFYRLISVDVYAGSNGVKRSAVPYNEEQRNLFNSLSAMGGVSGDVFGFMLQGTNIVFRPIPVSATTAQINYYPTPPTLSKPDDYFDSIGGWEEWVVLDAAIKCCLKDGQLETIGVLSSMKADQTARIKSAAPNRDQGDPERFHMTRGLEWADTDNDGWWA